MTRLRHWALRRPFWYTTDDSHLFRMQSKKAFSAAAVLALLLLGVGCAPVQPQLDLPAAPPADESAAAPGPEDATANPVKDLPNDAGPAAAVPAKKPYYVAYSAEALAKAKAEGRPVLLYFWAGWCPICRAEEPKLKASIEGGAVAVAGFRVDFDTQEDLKKTFRVPYQHTTVILDVRGDESARFTGPTSDADLQAALAAAAK